MRVTVQLQMFSGRRDLTWTLPPSQVKELVSLIDALTGRTLMKPEAVAGALGYRGFLIHAKGLKALAPEAWVCVHAGIVDRQRLALNLVDEQNGVERWLLQSAGRVIHSALRKKVERAIQFTPPVLPADWSAPKMKRRRRPLPPTPQPCRPPYEPEKWNAPGHVLLNKCYNYATDVMTDHGALPGEGSGTACCSTDASVNCKKVGAAAVRDKLQATNGVTTGNPPHAHFVALAVEPAGTPARDFHWYRRDCNGFWSHKVGNSPARNWDDSGQPIVDPQTCNRGPYSVFCGYYVCDPSIVTIF
jgi:hypothetical protein